MPLLRLLGLGSLDTRYSCPRLADSCILHQPPCHHTWDRAGSWDGSAWCNAHGYPLSPPTRRLYCCPCCSTCYALRLLWSHGLGAPQLFDVARATLVAQLTYASPAWTGFINCEDKARLQGVLKKLQRSGFLPHNFQTFLQICEAADAQLFSSIIHNDDHVLHLLLPPVKTHSDNLRKRAHDFVIPRCDDSLMRKNFIIRLISANSF